MMLKNWQEQAMKAWHDNNDNGVIEASTGSGKSFLFLQVIKDNPELRILIVVPTQHLMIQHYNLIQKECGVIAGLIGAGIKDFNNKVCVAVINSVRFKDLSEFDVLVLDEAHRYFSEINRLVLNHAFKKVLLLTATIHRQDNAEQDFLKKCPIVYSYSQTDCIRDNIINNFEIINVPATLTLEEQLRYDKINCFIKENFKHFNYDFNKLKSMLNNSVARDVMKAIQERKSLLYNAENKILLTKKYVLENMGKKIIVFGESISIANKVYDALKNECKCTVYHTGMGNLKARQQALKDYKDDVFDVLISCKALDEGLDLPSIEVAIIISGSSVRRQFIQRIGRTIRKSNKGISRIIQFYVPGTTDAKWLESRMKLINRNIIKVSYEGFQNEYD